MTNRINEDGILEKGKVLAESSVDSGMDEKTAYTYGFLHGHRECEENLKEALHLIEELRTEIQFYANRMDSGGRARRVSNKRLSWEEDNDQ